MMTARAAERCETAMPVLRTVNEARLDRFEMHDAADSGRRRRMPFPTIQSHDLPKQVKS
jgi:hypothetical protein